MAEIYVKNLCKEFVEKNKSPHQVLDCINLRVKDGEFVTFFGPNGCGKTTLLRILAGIEKPSNGSILVNRKPPRKGGAGFVFQDFRESMFPWRSVIRNVEIGMEFKGITQNKRRKNAEDILKTVNLLKHKDKYIYNLSGGMTQLVALCRALVYNPSFLLMDEPFSALDYTTTQEMELQILKIWQKLKKTIVFVSHDIDEAIFLADRVVVFSPRPARIKGIVKVNLPRPRKIAFKTDKTFFEIRKKVLKLFESEK